MGKQVLTGLIDERAKAAFVETAAAITVKDGENEKRGVSLAQFLEMIGLSLDAQLKSLKNPKDRDGASLPPRELPPIFFNNPGIAPLDSMDNMKYEEACKAAQPQETAA